MKFKAQFFSVLFILANVGCTNGCSQEKPGSTLKEGATITTASGLKIEEVKNGTGDLAESGKTVSVHYTGTFTDGKKFDSSYDRGQPITFPLGAGRVIKGWDEGIAGMRVGEKRKLTIPPELAYGAEGRPPMMPPNSTLLFDVELVEVK
jgi:FKBP-type peptidyl-prolyl cis-trans isomerase FkpA